MDQPHFEFDRSQDSLYVVRGSGRTEVPDLRPQDRQLLRFMATRNRANGGKPALCTYAEIALEMWPLADFEDAKSRLARIVLDLRRKMRACAEDEGLINVPREGYKLLEYSNMSSVDEPVFVVGPPIRHPKRFFGRTYELSEIFRLWNDSTLQSAAVIGPRRSGKTSLLRHLSNLHAHDAGQLRPEQRGRWLDRPERFRFAFVDFQDPRTRHREYVLSLILTSFGLARPDICNLSSFMDLIDAELDRPAIVFMDELEATENAPELDSDFWGALRSLSSSVKCGSLGFVVAMRDLRLAGSDEKPSPFLNIIGHVFPLEPFTEGEARELIASSPHSFAKPDVDWILNTSERWPCLIQVLCDERLKTLGSEGDQWRVRALERCERIRRMMGFRTGHE